MLLGVALRTGSWILLLRGQLQNCCKTLLSVLFGVVRGDRPGVGVAHQRVDLVLCALVPPRRLAARASGHRGERGRMM